MNNSWGIYRMIYCQPMKKDCYYIQQYGLSNKSRHVLIFQYQKIYKQAKLIYVLEVTVGGWGSHTGKEHRESPQMLVAFVFLIQMPVTKLISIYENSSSYTLMICSLFYVCIHCALQFKGQGIPGNLTPKFMILRTLFICHFIYI